MNVLFPLFLSVCILLLTVQAPESVLPALTAGISEALDLCSLLAVSYALWLGVTELIRQSEAHRLVAKPLAPVLLPLFGGLNGETAGLLSLNFTANMLGLGGVATPMGIACAKSLEKEFLSAPETPATRTAYESRTTALFLLNCCTVQLFPTSVISLRLSYGSVSPNDVWLPSVLTGCFSLTLAVICILLQKAVAKGRGVAP